MSPHVRLLIASALVATLGCQESSTPPVATSTDPAPIELELQPGVPVRITGQPWLISLVSVPEDSRCPAGVQCPWEGTALARFHLERYPPGNAAPTDVAIRLDQWADFAGLRILLTALRPAAVAGQSIPPANYRATVEVRSAAPSSSP